MDKETLKECPFCGGEGYYVYSLTDTGCFCSVRCSKCFGAITGIHTKEYATELWNRRFVNET